MIFIRIGYGFFRQEDVQRFTIEQYKKTAYVYLKGDPKPVELYPVNKDDVEFIVKNDTNDK